MAADDYLEKLPRLFEEFAVARDANPEWKEGRLFPDLPTLLRQTPLFWRTYAQPRLNRTWTVSGGICPIPGRMVQADLLWRGALNRAADLSQRHTPDLGTRALDVLHVACALELRLPHFLTFDERQR